MSRLVETQRAYERLAQLLNEEIRKRSGSTKELEGFRETLDVAFYLLGWAQFEYLVRKETEDRIDENAKARTVERHAWQYLKENVKNLKVRLRLDLIFHANPTVRASLDRDYDVRNEAAHNYKKLPPEAKGRISVWLRTLEDLVDKF
jgi:GAF domain-containing protein